MNYVLSPERLNAFVTFVVARHAVYVNRERGHAKPWTPDPILQQYRFCNVYRELDTVTKWISDNWREPHAGENDLWFAMAVARWVNWPDTLAEIGYPVPWNPKRFIAALEKRKAMGEKVWTGAYMIGTQGNAMDKAKFIAEGVLQPLWDNRETLRPRDGDTLKAFADRIIAVKNQGSFMVGQIVADAKYADFYLMEASDWHSWAVSGPGSRRGLNRLIDRDLKASWKEADFLHVLTDLRWQLNDALPKFMEKLHAQDVQNCLCEFDKYERVRLGQGQPRARYSGLR
jgi:hypothetical protein